MNVPGEHNVYNALATIAVSSRFGVNTSDMKRALEQFKATSKRMEIIQYENLLILNDCYNSNMASAEKALQTLANIQRTGQKIAILADMLELGKLSESHHREIGRIAATLNIDHLLAYGPLSLWTIEEARKRGLKASTHFEKKSELIKRLNGIIHRGDTILIKGSRGMAMEEVTDSLLKREKSS